MCVCGGAKTWLNARPSLYKTSIVYFFNHYITQTRLCNMQGFKNVVKMIISRCLDEKQ